jgi:hypothetical protein
MLATLQAALAKALAGPAEVNTILFVLAALVGQFLHGVLKWTRGEAESPLAWFTSNIKATIGAVIANIGITVAAIQLLPIDGMTAWASLYAGLLCGLGSDTLNKGARPTWTPEQRAAKAP